MSMNNKNNNKNNKNTNAVTFEDFEFKDRERITLWDKSDWKNVLLVYDKLKHYNKFIDKLSDILCMSKKAQDDPILFRKFKMSSDENTHVVNLQQKYQRYFFSLLNWWESSLEKYYNDQTTYWFDTNKKFEPVKCEIISNKLTSKGLELSASYMTGQSTLYPKFIALGTGSSEVRADDKSLETEIARDAVDYYAANGNIISSGKLFSANIANATIAEVGGMTSATSENSVIVWRSVITDANKRLEHEVGVDRPAASHTLYLTSR